MIDGDHQDDEDRIPDLAEDAAVTHANTGPAPLPLEILAIRWPGRVRQRSDRR
jgi:hypothetical protein